MNSLHEALNALARGARLGSLETNAAGFAEVVFGEGMLSLYIKAVDDSPGQMELSARIDALGRDPSPALAAALLDENARRTRGRLAVDGGGAVVLGQRFDVAHLDEKALLAAADAFVREVLTLETTGAAALRARAEQYAERAAPPQDGLIRL